MRIEWTVEAATELDDLLAYVAEQDPAAASLVADRVSQVENNIARFPKAGRHNLETDTYDRFIPKTRIILTYAIREDVTWIVSVWRTSRDPGTKPARS